MMGNCILKNWADKILQCKDFFFFQIYFIKFRSLFKDLFASEEFFCFLAVAWRMDGNNQLKTEYLLRKLIKKKWFWNKNERNIILQ